MMMVGTLPFQDHNESSTVFKILDVSYSVPEYCAAGFRDLLGKILVRCVCGKRGRSMTSLLYCRDIEKRLTGQGIAAHRWLASLDGSLGASVRDRCRAPSLLRSHALQWLGAIKASTTAVPELSMDQQENVLQTMVSNDMDRKTILDALAANHYDHITSTYYLLAQREVRTQPLM